MQANLAEPLSSQEFGLWKQHPFTIKLLEACKIIHDDTLAIMESNTLLNSEHPNEDVKRLGYLIGFAQLSTRLSNLEFSEETQKIEI